MSYTDDISRPNNFTLKCSLNFEAQQSALLEAKRARIGRNAESPQEMFCLQAFKVEIEKTDILKYV